MTRYASTPRTASRTHGTTLLSPECFTPRRWMSCISRHLRASSTTPAFVQLMDASLSMGLYRSVSVFWSWTEQQNKLEESINLVRRSPNRPTRLVLALHRWPFAQARPWCNRAKGYRSEPRNPREPEKCLASCTASTTGQVYIWGPFHNHLLTLLLRWFPNVYRRSNPHFPSCHTQTLSTAFRMRTRSKTLWPVLMRSLCRPTFHW